MPVLSKAVTYEEWLILPDVSDAIEEVVDGEVFVRPPPKRKHTEVVEHLGDFLRSQLNPREFREFKVWIAQFGVVIRRDPLTCRVPDLAVFRSAGVVEIDGYIHSAPELAVEVLSPSNTRAERALKIADYESLRVAEVWVLSIEARTVEVLRLESGRLVRTELLMDGTLSPRFAPDCRIPITSIWPN